MVDVRKLKEQAREAAARGKHRKAAELYWKIAHYDADPGWAHRAYVLAGDKVEGLRRLRYAAAAYGKQGMLLKGIAVCVKILEIEPKHLATQEMLAGFYATRDAPAVRVPTLPPPPALPRVGAPPRGPIALAPIRVPPPGRSSPPPAPEVEVVVGETLEEMPLSAVMPEARPSSRFPAAKIPLTEPPPPVEPTSARRSSAALSADSLDRSSGSRSSKAPFFRSQRRARSRTRWMMRSSISSEGAAVSRKRTRGRRRREREPRGGTPGS